MNTRWSLALALLATPTFAHAQTAATESTVAPEQPAPSLPPPPPGAGPDGAPPPAGAPPTMAPQPQPAGYPAQPGYPQPPPAYGQPYYGQPQYGQSPYGQPVYGQPAYPGAYAPPGYAMPHRRVVEYHGGPIPRGATLETHRPMALVVGGAVVFGGLYLISVLTASGSGGLISCSGGCGGGWLYAPIVGPFVVMGSGMRSTGDQIVLAIDGIFQTAGVVGFIVGMLRTQQVLVFTDYARNDHPSRPQWMLTPGAPGASIGATLSVMRF